MNEPHVKNVISFTANPSIIDEINK